eukprot:5390143-Amphidinium_carterae.1
MPAEEAGDAIMEAEQAQEETFPPVLSPEESQDSVGPQADQASAAYYSAHFREVGPDVFARIHSRFAAETAAEPLKERTRPGEMANTDKSLEAPGQTFSSAYYAAHFRGAGQEAFAALHSRFPSQ